MFDVRTNITVIFGKENKDPFGKLYEDLHLNAIMTTLYILGLVSCIGLIMISWFEKSGQAGTYRSLVNQLVSMRLDQLVVFYIVGVGLVAIRRLTGPLPITLCKIGSFFQYLTVFNSCHFTILIVGTKFCFIYIFKSIPVMDDKLFSTFFMIAVILWSFLAWAGKLYIDQQLTLPEQICSGTWNYNRLEDFHVPLGTIVISYTLVLYIFFSIAIFIKKRKDSSIGTQPIFLYNNGQFTDLSNLVSTFISTLLLGTSVLTLSALNMFVRDPETMVENTMINVVLQMSGIPLNFGLVSVQAIHHFWNNKNIRKAARRLFFHEHIVTPVNSISPNVP